MILPIETTSYTHARENLARLLDKIERDNAVALVKRRGHEDIAMLRADELNSLLETLHLLRSPVNTQRLFESLDWSTEGDKALFTESDSLKQLCQELGIERD